MLNHQQRQRLAKIGAIGGKTRGPTKARGSSDYYRDLQALSARKRIANREREQRPTDVSDS
jgi:hypothetical protein